MCSPVVLKLMSVLVICHWILVDRSLLLWVRESFLNSSFWVMVSSLMDQWSIAGRIWMSVWLSHFYVFNWVHLWWWEKVRYCLYAFWSMWWFVGEFLVWVGDDKHLEFVYVVIHNIVWGFDLSLTYVVVGVLILVDVISFYWCLAYKVYELSFGCHAYIH